MTGDVIRAKEIRLLQDVNCLLAESSRVDLKFSAGWLWRFQKRWNLKSRKTHGEAASVDEAAVRRDLPKIRLACSRYSKEDVWNADETGLNNSMDPDRKICQTAKSGSKVDKRRITVLLCAK